MPKLSQYARERVVSLHSAGTNLTKIAKLLEEEGIKASRSAVSLFVSINKLVAFKMQKEVVENLS